MKAAFAMTLLMLGSMTAYATTFDGYECTDDCSGHQAGYDWAEQNDIDDEDACDTPSQSFNEGCQSYVEGGSGVTSSIEDDDD
ncbi:hypothetical protein ACIPM0_21120 [Pseudomonas sichuanensis]|uniref:hypothetical protein n=1 Tax=Pseudomonas TaxID=286 RepID=UPI00380AA969